MATKWQDKLALLWEKMQLVIINGVREVGKTNSRDYRNKVIKLPDDLQFNVDNDFIIEVYEQGYYSNNGQIYSFSSLDFEQSSEIADYCYNLRTYYQPEWGDEDRLVTPDGTELWSYYVYSTKELAQEDFPDRKILAFSGDDIENPYFIK